MKIQTIGIYTTIDYLQELGNEAIDPRLSNSGLSMILLSTFTFINNGIILAQQIKNRTYSSNIIYEIYYIDTGVHNKELDEWTNAVMRKFTQAGITIPQQL